MKHCITLLLAGLLCGRAVAQNAAGDTTFITGDFPEHPLDFQLNSQLYSVRNARSPSLHFCKRRSRQLVWKIFDPYALAKPAFDAKYPGANTDSLLAAFAAYTDAPAFAPRCQIHSVALRDTTAHLLVQFRLPGFMMDQSFTVIAILKGDTYRGPWVFNEPLEIADSAIRDQTFGNVQRHWSAGTSVPLDIERSVVNDYSRKWDSVKRANPSLYSAGSRLFANRDGSYKMTIHPSDSADYKFLARYGVSPSGRIVSTGLLPIYKGGVFAEAGIGSTYGGTAGSGPFIMTQIDNTLFDIEQLARYELPLDRGNYNFPQSTRIGEPRMATPGLLVWDVVHRGDWVKVLYSHGARGLSVLHYDLANLRTISDRPFFVGDARAQQDPQSIARFDGMNRIAVLYKNCRCVVAYPAP